MSRKKVKFYVAYSLIKPNLPIGVYDTFEEMVEAQGGMPGAKPYKMGVFKDEAPSGLFDPLVTRAMQIRIRRRMNLREASSEIGVSLNTLRNWEMGIHYPNTDATIRKLTEWIRRNDG